MIKVSGSIFRRALFWAHLSCGVTAGLLILSMSFTGVLLTYERQIIAASSINNRVALSGDVAALTADELLDKARAEAAPGAQIALVFDKDPAYPVIATVGREQLLLHPQTGALLPDAASSKRDFFRTITSWHRWLGGEPSSTRAKFIDAANLLFAFIILSGIYLWLPAVWKWPGIRGRIFFRASYINSRARDYNWHHAFSFWMLIPLLLIAVSGVVMSYPWANSALFAAYGETPPQRQGPPNGAAPASNARLNGASTTPSEHVSIQQLLDVARSQFSNWQRITIPANSRGDSIDISAELISSDIRPPRQILTLSTQDAAVIRTSSSPAQSAGQRARAWIRFIHTGEEYGVIGQTIAGLASLAACFLFYTGLALAWRRLVVPLYRKQ